MKRASAIFTCACIAVCAVTTASVPTPSGVGIDTGHGSLADKFGPRDLDRKASSARKKAQQTRARIVKRAVAWAKKHAEERPDSILAFQGLLAQWVPDGERQARPELPERHHLSTEEREKLVELAEDLAESAERMLAAELGGAAGFEAYRALGLDSGQESAGRLLNYEEHDGRYQHMLYASMAANSMKFTDRGWVGEGGSNDGATPTSRSKELPHVSRYTFFEIHTDIDPAIAKDWGAELDELMMWMRARFLHVPRYREPEWPVEVRIYSDADAIQANNDRIPTGGFAHWDPRQKHIVVKADTFVPGRTMPIEWVVKHELAHAFLDLAFPAIPDPKTGLDNAVSGWLTEGFEAWIYGASTRRPNDVLFWDSVPTNGPGVAALLEGRNVLGELVDVGWIPSRSSPLADVAPVLADWCAADEIRWEGFARLTANLHSYNQSMGDFGAQLGSPGKVSKALRAWVEDHRGR